MNNLTLKKTQNNKSKVLTLAASDNINSITYCESN